LGLSILHYVNSVHPVLSGYTIRTHSIAKAQKKIGLSPNVAVSVKSLMKNYFEKINYASKYSYEGIDYYSNYNGLTDALEVRLASKLLMRNNRLTNFLKRQFYSIEKNRMLKRYYSFLSSEVKDVDLIHAHTPSLVFDEASQINNYFKKKIIYELRGFWNLSRENFNGDVMNAVEDEISASQKADKCVAICQGIADVLIKAGINSNKIEIVPNGVEPEKFTASSKDIKLMKELNLTDKIVFGYITNVRWFEGIQTVVKAWPQILKEIPNAVFLLIGGGDYLLTVDKMIKEYNLENNILKLGMIKHEKIPDYYMLIDIFVVPRINVPVSNIVTPLKPLEAMAAGKALITSDVNALKEIVINGETGMLFRADDFNHLADICIQLAKDKILRDALGLNGKNWVIKNRTWDEISRKYLELYNNLLS